MPNLQSKDTQVEIPSGLGQCTGQRPSVVPEVNPGCVQLRAPTFVALEAAASRFTALPVPLQGEICCPVHGWTNRCSIGSCGVA